MSLDELEWQASMIIIEQTEFFFHRNINFITILRVI